MVEPDCSTRIQIASVVGSTLLLDLSSCQKPEKSVCSEGGKARVTGSRVKTNMQETRNAAAILGFTVTPLCELTGGEKTRKTIRRLRVFAARSHHRYWLRRFG